jgi:hypothetical protein
MSIPANQWLEARAKLDSYGVEQVCQDVAHTMTLTSIAKAVGVSIGSLLTWIEADPERSACVRESRIATAQLWDERAEQGISEAADEFELKKAREIAHHYRWRAAKIAPKRYGDKVENTLVGADGGSIDLHHTITFVKPQ